MLAQRGRRRRDSHQECGNLVLAGTKTGVHRSNRPGRRLGLGHAHRSEAFSLQGKSSGAAARRWARRLGPQLHGADRGFGRRPHRIRRSLQIGPLLRLELCDLIFCPLLGRFEANVASCGTKEATNEALQHRAARAWCAATAARLTLPCRRNDATCLFRGAAESRGHALVHCFARTCDWGELSALAALCTRRGPSCGHALNQTISGTHGAWLGGHDATAAATTTPSHSDESPLSRTTPPVEPIASLASVTACMGTVIGSTVRAAGQRRVAIICGAWPDSLG